MHNATHLTPERQAHLYACGALTVFALGTLGLVLLGLAALWLAVQIASLLIESMLEALETMGQLYTTSDPLIKLCILVAVGHILYRLVRRSVPATRRLTHER